MLIAYFPLVVCILGLLIFVLGKDKISRVGEHMFWTGLLVTLMSTMAKTVHLL